MFVNVNDAKKRIIQGEIIAYPTEAIFGLGCDPFNENALAQILTLKKRPQEKGFILLISKLSQLHGLIDEKSELKFPLIQKYWPGPTTFLFPKHPKLPPTLTGEFNTIAIRLTKHPVANALCQTQAIVSTSANVSGEAPLKNAQDVAKAFPNSDLAIVDAPVGNATKPSTIIDMMTGAIIRQ